MTDPTAVVISGRTVRDYKLCRQSIEPGFRILRCATCTAKVVLSPDGMANLERYSSLKPIVLCNPCAMVVVPRHAEPIMSRHASEQVERNPACKATLDEMLAKLDWPKEP